VPEPPLEERRTYRSFALRAYDPYVTALPTDAELEELVLNAFAELPQEFRERISNLAVLIEDEPPPGERWLGVYRGVPLPQQSVFHAWMWPHTITIYRGPLLRLWGDDRDRLAREVRHIVRHEVAHYFGISDARLIEIDRY
jgi:predicted Zn-dependent protease with MMP-like domain